MKIYVITSYSIHYTKLYDEECITAIKEGEADLCFQNLYTAEQLVHQDEKNKLADEFFDDFSSYNFV